MDGVQAGDPPPSAAASAAASATDGTGRRALCLCGGGITGAMYELGALVALDDYLGHGEGVAPGGRPLTSTGFDLYVGTSAGSFIATALCGGLRPEIIARGVLGYEPERRFWPSRRQDLFRFESSQAIDLLHKLGRAVFQAVRAAARGEWNAEAFGSDLLEALPGGVFTLTRYQAFLERFLQEQGLTTSFDAMPRELLITANDLDRGHRVVFGPLASRQGDGAGGRGGLADVLTGVSIARAVCASSAITPFFAPVRIDGRDYIDGATGKVDHLDLALRRGARLILVINPIVPFHNDLATERPLTDRGLLTIYDQSVRMSVKARLHQGLRRWAHKAPGVDVLLLEPDEREIDMFRTHPLDYDARQHILRYGYHSAAAQIHARKELFASICARHGLHGDPARLRTEWP